MTQWQNLSVDQNNDTTFTISLTLGGSPFDLTNYTPTLYLKATESSDDGTATTFTVGAGLTIVSAPRGQLTWKLPHANTTTPGTQWWRIDAVDNSLNRTTFIGGNITVQAV